MAKSRKRAKRRKDAPAEGAPPDNLGFLELLEAGEVTGVQIGDARLGHPGARGAGVTYPVDPAVVRGLFRDLAVPTGSLADLVAKKRASLVLMLLGQGARVETGPDGPQITWSSSEPRDDTLRLRREHATMALTMLAQAEVAEREGRTTAAIQLYSRGCVAHEYALAAPTFVRARTERRSEPPREKGRKVQSDRKAVRDPELVQLYRRIQAGDEGLLDQIEKLDHGVEGIPKKRMDRLRQAIEVGEEGTAQTRYVATTDALYLLHPNADRRFRLCRWSTVRNAVLGDRHSEQLR